MSVTKTIDPSTLRTWLETGRKISILDIRSMEERMEWFIPGSILVDAFDKVKASDPEALQGLHLDKANPVVTVCAAGKKSLIVAGLLQEQGYDAYSLQGGMRGWSLAWNTAGMFFPDFEVIQFRRTGKGCLSYLVTSGNEAVIIDASLPIEIYLEFLKIEKPALKFVIETHIHADHLSRSKQLADHNKVALHLPVPNKVNFNFTPVTDTTVFLLGQIRINAINTPGHTLESTSYLIDNKVLLTGDTLFINGVGRPDLKTNHDDAILKSKMLFQSLQKLLRLDDHMMVLPGHTSQPVNFDNIPIQTTIGRIKNTISMLRLNEEDFIDTILQRIPPAPPNYQSIAERNIKGDFSDIDPVDLEAGANRCAIT